MELCVCRSQNISEPNGSGCDLCLRSKCSQTGRPTASSPAKNHGVKNPILEQPPPDGEVFAQPFIEGPGRIHQKVIQSRRARLGFEAADVRINPPLVFV